METKTTEKQSMISVNVDHKFLWSILILLVVGLSYASTTISDSYINTTGNVNGNAIFQNGNQVIDVSGATFNTGANLTGLDQVNATEIYANGNRLTKPYDVVVCRNADTGCDVICTDSDCYGEIQYALDANNVLFFKEGAFPITQTLNVTSNHHIIGSGMYATTIVHNGSVGPIIQNEDRTNGNNNIIIENIGFDANADLKSDINFDYGIRFDGVKDFVIDKIYITNSKADLINLKGANTNSDVDGQSEGKIINSYFYNSSREGIQVEYGSNILISGNHFEWISSRAVNFENFVENGTMEGNSILNNIIINSTGGVVIGNVVGVKTNRNFIIANNNIHDSPGYCWGSYCLASIGIQVISIGTSMIYDNILITGNTIRNINSNDSVLADGADGIFVRAGPGNRVKVSDNMIYNAERYGIYASAESDITDNTIESTGDDAIVADISGVTISGNTVINATGYGILIYNSDNTIVDGNRILNQSMYGDNVSISAYGGSNNITIQNNYISGVNIYIIDMGIQVADAYATVRNNEIYDVMTKYSITENNVYVDDYEYDSIPACASDNVFNNRYITNSSDYLCRCDAGAWKCLGPFI